MTDAEALASALEPAHRVLVFTGAGMSTRSGIPDYRGPDGLWKKRQPVYYADFLASADKRRYYWEGKAQGWEGFAAARPNAAHDAIVQLERMSRLQCVVTQNIDGLHQAAGTSRERLIEIHGTNLETECIGCARRGDPSVAVAEFRRTSEVPTCECGAWLKLATVSFGQAVPPELLQRAARESAASDLVLALGSTLSVQPACEIPLVGVRRGAAYVIVNQGETVHDELATLRLEADVAEILPQALDILLSTATN